VTVAIPVYALDGGDGPVMTDPEGEPTEASVEVTRDAVVLRLVVEHDSEVRRVVGEAADPLEAAHQCLRVGARAVRAANVSVDATVVERQFEQLAGRFEQQVAEAVAQIGAVTTELLDGDDGALTTVLARHRDELEALLGHTFDPESRAGALALIERVVTEAVAEYLNADDEGSPLGRATHEIRRTVHERVNDVVRQVQSLQERLAANAAIAEALERSTQKGLRFEEVVHDRVAAIAAGHGDLAEHVGTEGGQDASRCGDEVVTLNPDDTGGEEVRFVLEVKHRRLGWRDTLAELDRAMANRGAAAGIAVFAHQEQAPTTVPFHCNASRAVVVLDPEGGDDGALRLAYMWARWVARRDRARPDDGFDPERVRDLIDEVNRALQRVRTIRRHHTEAAKGIERARDELGALEDDARRAIETLGRELLRSPEA